MKWWELYLQCVNCQKKTSKYTWNTFSLMFLWFWKCLKHKRKFKAFNLKLSQPVLKVENLYLRRINFTEIFNVRVFSSIRFWFCFVESRLTGWWRSSQLCRWLGLSIGLTSVSNCFSDDRGRDTWVWGYQGGDREVLGVTKLLKCCPRTVLLHVLVVISASRWAPCAASHRRAAVFSTGHPGGSRVWL